MNSGTLESSTSTASPRRPSGAPSTTRASACRRASTAWKTRESFEACAVLRRAASTFSQRADSIGVSVKLTSSDTTIANAIVRPKLFMKRPTMPPMKATGHEDRHERQRRRQHGEADLLASPSTAAWNGSSCFSSMKRKMFSSTTIASSMTMPTASVSASSVIDVEREAHVPDQAERGDDRGRDGDRRDDRRAQVRRGRGARRAPRGSRRRSRCSSTSWIDASMNSDLSRTIAQLVAGRQRAA